MLCCASLSCSSAAARVEAREDIGYPAGERRRQRGFIELGITTRSGERAHINENLDGVRYRISLKSSSLRVE